MYNFNSRAIEIVRFHIRIDAFIQKLLILSIQQFPPNQYSVQTNYIVYQQIINTNHKFVHRSIASINTQPRISTTLRVHGASLHAPMHEAIKYITNCYI